MVVVVGGRLLLDARASVEMVGSRWEAAVMIYARGALPCHSTVDEQAANDANPRTLAADRAPLRDAVQEEACPGVVDEDPRLQMGPPGEGWRQPT